MDTDPTVVPEMRVLVTGSTGFIGSNLCQYLGRSGYRVFALVRQPPVSELKEFPSVTQVPISFSPSTEELDEALSLSRATHVIHCATYFSRAHSPSQIAEMIQANVTFGTLILDACSRSSVHHVTNLSSFWQGAHSRFSGQKSLYASTKRAFLEILDYYEKNSDFQIANVYLRDTYGPDDKRKKILQVLLEAAVSGAELRMSDGFQRINLLHVSDVVRGLVQIMRNGHIGDFELRCEEDISIRELVALVQEVINRDIRVRWGALPSDPSSMVVSKVLAPRPNGWNARVNLREGVNEVWNAISR